MVAFILAHSALISSFSTRIFKKLILSFFYYFIIQVLIFYSKERKGGKKSRARNSYFDKSVHNFKQNSISRRGWLTELKTNIIRKKRY